MNTLQVGFSRVNITPPLGVRLMGYFRKRLAEGVRDELEANCICFACEDTKVVLISLDHLGVMRKVLNDLREEIARTTGIPAEAVYIHSTHTHTGPAVDPDAEAEVEQIYYKQFFRKVVDSAVLAMQDLKPAKMGYAVSTAPNIAYIRRFYMKDGPVATNPKINSPDIIGPVGKVDERVNVLRFDREEDTVILANFGNHPDSVGGNLVSADWPGFVRKYTEQAIPGTKCLFFTGVQGDVNHVNRFPEEWENNKGYDYGNAQRMGRVITGAVMQVYDKMRYVDVDKLKYVFKVALAPANKADPALLPEAHRINDMYVSGMTQQEILPDVKGMLRTTIIAEAGRMVRLENAPDYFEMPMTGIAVGPVAFIGIPGEPFSGVGFSLKETEGWAMILPTCNTNGKEGYFPMKEAYDEGGYEARSSNFKAGIAELICEEGKKILAEMAE